MIWGRGKGVGSARRAYVLRPPYCPWPQSRVLQAWSAQVIQQIAPLTNRSKHETGVPDIQIRRRDEGVD